MATTAERLVAVQTAISAVLQNQSYRLGDRSVTRADYAALVDDEQRLLRQLARESGTRPALISMELSNLGYSGGQDA